MKKVIVVIVTLILAGCGNCPRVEDIEKPKIMSSSAVGFSDVYTFEHDGCLWILAERTNGVSLLHHPKCANHETAFR